MTFSSVSHAFRLNPEILSIQTIAVRETAIAPIQRKKTSITLLGIMYEYGERFEHHPKPSVHQCFSEGLQCPIGWLELLLGLSDSLSLSPSPALQDEA